MLVLTICLTTADIGCETVSWPVFEHPPNIHNETRKCLIKAPAVVAEFESLYKNYKVKNWKCKVKK